MTGEDLSTFIYRACSAVTLYEAMWLFADDVYFQESISGMTRRNSEWLHQIYREVSEMSADPGQYSPEAVRAVDAVAGDFAEQLPFTGTLRKTDDWLEWFNLWMGPMENPQNFESLQDLIRLDAYYPGCPLGDPMPWT